MNGILLLVSLLFCQYLFAQGILIPQDHPFKTTETLGGGGGSLPIYFSPTGELSLLNQTSTLSFSPLFHLGFSLGKIKYISPGSTSDDPIWIERQTLRWEVGLGGGSSLAPSVSMGLFPYVGGLYTSLRHHPERKNKFLLRPPKRLNEFNSWAVGDLHRYQTYSGVNFTFGVGISPFPFSLAGGSVSLQNQWVVQMKKVAEAEIELSLLEENLHRRRISLGPLFSNATLGWLNGKQLYFQFRLKMTDLNAEILYSEFLKGNMEELQYQLCEEAQKILWNGLGRQFYVGIPYLIGKAFTHHTYKVREDNQDVYYDFIRKDNNGVLLPTREQWLLTRLSSQNMQLVWRNEFQRKIGKVAIKKVLLLEKLFKGHEPSLISRDKFLNQQYALSLSLHNINQWRKTLPFNLASLTAYCQILELKCQDVMMAQKQMNKLLKLLNRNGIKAQLSLARFLLKRPWILKLLLPRETLIFRNFLTQSMDSAQEAFFSR